MQPGSVACSACSRVALNSPWTWVARFREDFTQPMQHNYSAKYLVTQQVLDICWVDLVLECRVEKRPISRSAQGIKVPELLGHPAITWRACLRTWILRRVSARRCSWGGSPRRGTRPRSATAWSAPKKSKEEGVRSWPRSVESTWTVPQFMWQCEWRLLDFLSAIKNGTNRETMCIVSSLVCLKIASKFLQDWTGLHFGTEPVVARDRPWCVGRAPAPATATSCFVPTTNSGTFTSTPSEAARWWLEFNRNSLCQAWDMMKV